MIDESEFTATLCKISGHVCGEEQGCYGTLRAPDRLENDWLQLPLN